MVCVKGMATLNVTVPRVIDGFQKNTDVLCSVLKEDDWTSIHQCFVCVLWQRQHCAEDRGLVCQ